MKKKNPNYEYISCGGLRMRWEWKRNACGYKWVAWWENFVSWGVGNVLYLDCNNLNAMILILCFCFATYSYWGNLSKMYTGSCLLKLLVDLLLSQSKKFIEKLLLLGPHSRLTKSNSESGAWLHQWPQLYPKKVYIFNQTFINLVLITELQSSDMPSLS